MNMADGFTYEQVKAVSRFDTIVAFEKFREEIDKDTYTTAPLYDDEDKGYYEAIRYVMDKLNETIANLKGE